MNTLEHVDSSNVKIRALTVNCAILVSNKGAVLVTCTWVTSQMNSSVEINVITHVSEDTWDHICRVKTLWYMSYSLVPKDLSLSKTNCWDELSTSSSGCITSSYLIALKGMTSFRTVMYMPIYSSLKQTFPMSKIKLLLSKTFAYFCVKHLLRWLWDSVFWCCLCVI